jgi:hypothetical protein
VGEWIFLHRGWGQLDLRPRSPLQTLFTLLLSQALQDIRCGVPRLLFNDAKEIPRNREYAEENFARIVIAGHGCDVGGAPILRSHKRGQHGQSDLPSFPRRQ